MVRNRKCFEHVHAARRWRDVLAVHEPRLHTVPNQKQAAPFPAPLYLDNIRLLKVPREFFITGELQFQDKRFLDTFIVSDCQVNNSSWSCARLSKARARHCGDGGPPTSSVPSNVKQRRACPFSNEAAHLISMAPISGLSHLLNPLATSVQLEVSASQLDGVPNDLENSVRFETARLLQAAGVLLRLPQEVIAESIVILFRFWTGPEGGSLLDHDARSVAAASLYLTAKPSPHPVSARQILNTFEFLSSLPSSQLSSPVTATSLNTKWNLLEGQYEAARDQLYTIESQILCVLGFQTHVALPHPLCINYLQTLRTFDSSDGPLLAKAAFRHLNGALFSPQLLYLTHQPSAITTAAIYLAAKEVRVKLPEVEWWELFDVDREELGFLVVALRSLEGYALEEKRKWSGSRVPLTTIELQSELERVNKSQ